MATDINSILKKYLAAMGKSEVSASELTKDLRVWVVENGELVKEKIENRIDETASRMGFVKVSDLDNLLARISDLESRLPDSKTKVKRSVKKSAASSIKKSVKKSSKNSVKKSSGTATKKIVRERTKG
jgi:polyhydroxyalkanoate synthesis regulator phasin